MKLATMRTSARDGKLIVVSRDLRRAVAADGIASTLQAALDDWDAAAPRLQALQQQLETGSVPHAFDLDMNKLAAPLPRAYAWIDSSVYLNHMELARKLRGVKPPEGYKEIPTMSNGVCHTFLGARDTLLLPPGDVGLDIEGEYAAILGDVPARTPREQAGKYIRLFILVNDSTLRTVFAEQVAKGYGNYQGKLLVTMSPVAVTPDELGTAWDGAKLSLPLECRINDRVLGMPNTGVDMYFDFPTIISRATTMRGLPAGTVLGSGTISNHDRAAGFACIAEQRMVETIEHGKPRTEYLKPGDRVSIEMKDADGHSIFGSIRQTVGEPGVA